MGIFSVWVKEITNKHGDALFGHMPAYDDMSVRTKEIFSNGQQTSWDEHCGIFCLSEVWLLNMAICCLISIDHQTNSDEALYARAKYHLTYFITSIHAIHCLVLAILFCFCISFYCTFIIYFQWAFFFIFNHELCYTCRNRNQYLQKRKNLQSVFVDEKRRNYVQLQFFRSSTG